MQTLTFCISYRWRCLKYRGDELGLWEVLASAYGGSARVVCTSKKIQW